MLSRACSRYARGWPRLPPRAAALRRAVALVGRTHPRAVAVGAFLGAGPWTEDVRLWDCRCGGRRGRHEGPRYGDGDDRARRTGGLHPYACRYLLLGAPMMADGACADARVPGMVNDASNHQEVAFPNAEMAWHGYVVVAKLGALPPTVPTRRLASASPRAGIRFARPADAPRSHARRPVGGRPPRRLRVRPGTPAAAGPLPRDADGDADALRSLLALSTSSDTEACRGRPPPPRHPLSCECQLLSRPGEHLVPLPPPLSSSCNFPQIPKSTFPDGLVPFDPHWFLIDFLI